MRAVSSQKEKKSSNKNRARKTRLKTGSQESLKRQLRFERLLTDISAQFVSLPADRLDNEIRSAQRQLCECLNVDLCVLWQLSADERSLWLTHIHAPSDFKPLPEILDAREAFPWFLEKMLRKEPIVSHSERDLPSAAARDLESWQYFGIKSALTFPLSAGGGAVFGSLTFCVLRKERIWEPDLINRLQLVAQIFSSALARKMAETALKESETRVSLAAEAAEAGLWMLDKNTGLIWATERAREIFKFTSDEEISFQKFIAAVHPDDRERIQRKVEESFQRGTGYNEEYRIHPAGSGWRWVSARGRLIPGKSNCLIGVLVDITERKRKEDETRNLRGELMHVSRIVTLNELSASLAHEINQPLTAILNNAEAGLCLLSKKKPDLPEIRRIFSDIIEDDTRAGNVIQQLRALMKKQELEFRPLDTAALIRQTVRFVQSEAALRKKNISVRCDEKIPLVCGDRVQLQQVLLNLIANGLEAMADQDGGDSDLVVGCEKENGGVRVFVRDHGPGVPLEVGERVFEPFFTTKADGLGMGLSISRSIVEAHGGKLKVENNREGGATFSFILPACVRGRR